MIWLLLLLSVQRPYWRVSIAALPTSTRTHVEVTGRVVYVTTEADGDIHFRLSDDHAHLVVCEIIPAIPLPRPTVGQRVIVRGIRRVDAAHRWSEVHPVESWWVRR